MTDFSSIPALKPTTILEATWTNCPTDVKKEIRALWINQEFGNDNYYYKWEIDIINQDGKENNPYPAITKYLADNNITECLIHYWW